MFWWYLSMSSIDLLSCLKCCNISADLGKAEQQWFLFVAYYKYKEVQEAKVWEPSEWCTNCWKLQAKKKLSSVSQALALSVFFTPLQKFYSKNHAHVFRQTKFCLKKI